MQQELTTEQLAQSMLPPAQFKIVFYDDDDQSKSPLKSVIITEFTFQEAIALFLELNPTKIESDIISIDRKINL